MSNKIIKINNEFKNKGVSFPDDMSFMDILQSWNYLTRFMLDLIENKADYRLIPQDGKTKSRSKFEFKAFIKYWYKYTEKTIPDDIKVIIREFK